MAYDDKNNIEGMELRLHSKGEFTEISFKILACKNITLAQTEDSNLIVPQLSFQFSFTAGRVLPYAL